MLSMHSPSSTWVGALVPTELKSMYHIIICLEKKLRLFIAKLLFHDCLFFVLPSFVPLRSSTTGSSSRENTMARLRSQNNLG